MQQDDATGDTWTGQVNVVVATDGAEDPRPAPDASVTGVWCELVVGNASRGSVLAAPDGTGATATAGPIRYTAAWDEPVGLCTHATIGGTPLVHCDEYSFPEYPPNWIIEVVNNVIDTINEIPVNPIDQPICPALTRIAPVVNLLGHPELLYIEPTHGDATVLGALFWDCPPYEIEG